MQLRIQLIGVFLIAHVASVHAGIIQLYQYSEINTVTFSDFENVTDRSDPDFADVSFLPYHEVSFASNYVEGVTPSGSFGLVQYSPADGPLSANLGSDYYEIGMTFGNDDFSLVMDVNLEVFDANDSLIGSVTVISNGNDWADQFIGLRSTTPFRRFAIDFDRPPFESPHVYIDDLALGVAAVPEPSTTFAMCLLSVIGFVNDRRRRR